MRLLLTNDDGIDAPGIAALERACELLEAELFVVAPAEPASQVGHRVTTDVPIAVEQRGSQHFAVAGTPADCVRLALNQLLEQAPDYVISGINYGGNLGLHDLHISGTVAAVREAVLHGVPGAAISNFHRADFDFNWDTAALRAQKVIASLLEQSLGEHEFWNVNLPHVESGAREPEMRLCEPERHPLPIDFVDDHGNGAFRYTGRYHERGRSDGSDVDICFGGDIAVTRVRL